MIRFHPSNDELLGFAEGSIAPNQALMISAHCDMCSQCALKVKAFIETSAEEVFDTPSNTHATIDNELANMMDAITSRPCDHRKNLESDTLSQHPSSISLNGTQFTLPPSLRRLAAYVGAWSRIVGGVWQAPVSIGGKNLAHFIFLESGSSVPEHTHIGNEHTLVLRGKFSDGDSTYGCGDFIALNNTHTHSPFAASSDGCLVFSIIDEPLHFTSGWAKLINPLSHLYFKVSTK